FGRSARRWRGGVKVQCETVAAQLDYMASRVGQHLAQLNAGFPSGEAEGFAVDGRDCLLCLARNDEIRGTSGKVVPLAKVTPQREATDKPGADRRLDRYFELGLLHAGLQAVRVPEV